MDKTDIDKLFFQLAFQTGQVSKSDLIRALNTQKSFIAKSQKYVSLDKVVEKMSLLSNELLTEVRLKLESSIYQSTSPHPQQESIQPDDSTLPSDDFVQANDEQATAPPSDDSVQANDEQATIPPSDDSDNTITKDIQQQDSEGAENDSPIVVSGENPNFTIVVDSDLMNARLLPGKNGLSGVGLEVIKEAIEQSNICYGIVDDTVISDYLKATSHESACVIATGTSPIHPIPTQAKFHFDTDPLRVGTIKEDDMIDWKDHGTLPHVEECALIAEKIPGKKGFPGKDVFGQQITPTEAPPFRIIVGKGVSEEDDKYYAKERGIPQFGADNVLSVLNTYKIPGDVGIETGHVEFDGHVEVGGAVKEDYQVKSRSLTVNATESAKLDVNGDILVHKGLHGTRVRSEGNLKARHIAECDIRSKGNIIAQKEIIESTVETGGRCLVTGGSIISCEIKAKKGVYAKNVGTDAAPPSNLTVGIDFRYRRERQRLLESISKAEKRIKKLRPRLKELTDAMNSSSAQMGEAVQEQDALMVEQRELEQKMAQADESAKKSLTHKLRVLTDKKALVDRQVDQLVEQDELMMTEQIKVKKEYQNAEETIVKSNAELQELKKIPKSDIGYPIVEVSGTLYAGTTITTPNCVYTVEEDLHHIRITETNLPEPDAPPGWHIKIRNI